jgi:phytoene/squalene synthetase
MVPSLASSITKAASKQTYITIRLLADRERVEDAYRAYGYFRWVDDVLDSDSGSICERAAFLKRQKSLLESCYLSEPLRKVSDYERMLVELVHSDIDKNSGLQTYLRNMMHVMDFDVRRRGRLISQAELTDYTQWLASAVTENLHYFIGHGCNTPHDERRYMAVSAAHITHMLRDTFDDIQAGYFNIPLEVLEANHIEPQDVHSEAYRDWVKARVQLARQQFEEGKVYLAQVQNYRFRLATFAYTSRFEWLLDTIERENYLLRPQYNERKSIRTGLRMSWLTVSYLIHEHDTNPLPQPVVRQPLIKL